MSFCSLWPWSTMMILEPQNSAWLQLLHPAIALGFRLGSKVVIKSTAISRRLSFLGYPACAFAMADSRNTSAHGKKWDEMSTFYPIWIWSNLIAEYFRSLDSRLIDAESGRYLSQLLTKWDGKSDPRSSGMAEPEAVPIDSAWDHAVQRCEGMQGMQ